jgi:hypothetical protein
MYFPYKNEYSIFKAVKITIRRGQTKMSFSKMGDRNINRSLAGGWYQRESGGIQGKGSGG